jgi:uncharacterized protein
VTPRARARARVAGLSVVLLLQVWGCLIEPNRLVVREQTIEIDDWPAEFNGLRIALLSDIHTDHMFVSARKVAHVVDRVNGLRPELILLLGDYTKGMHDEDEGAPPEQTAALLRRLTAPLGVFSVLGNHDWWYDGERVRRALEHHGIRVLENDATELRWRDRPLWLAGLSDHWTDTPLIPQTLARVPAGQPVIVMTHSPDVFPDIPDAVRLVVAGHTHGGQVAVPFLGSPFAGSSLSRRYRRGHFSDNERHLYVTSGLGTSLVPARLGVPPEIVVLTIQSG